MGSVTSEGYLSILFAVQNECLALKIQLVMQCNIKHTIKSNNPLLISFDERIKYDYNLERTFLSRLVGWNLNPDYSFIIPLVFKYSDFGLKNLYHLLEVFYDSASSTKKQIFISTEGSRMSLLTRLKELSSKIAYLIWIKDCSFSQFSTYRT